ncbi:MAG: MFS transporter [Hydrogenophaga sp.]|uniref:MFS transporter n=1 Tax=Hydrogenophaga sp. TaxID=1904254 RepID=UPI003D9BF323
MPRSLWALMVGNFVIGTGVMAVPGTLNDISTSLQVSIPQAGLLITAGAILMGVGAPLFATLVAGWDRRRLLTLSLLWYALFMGISAFAPSYGWLLPLRVLAVIPPAIFTPQAAACVGLLVPDAQRGKAITFVFLGWSVASVLGMPLAAWIGGLFGWRWAFGLVAVLALLVAGWVWRAMPDGIRPAALSRQAWAQTLGSPPLMLAVGVTLLSAFGQFTLFAYFAPYHQQVLGLGAGALSLLFLWFGAFGLTGNVLLSRRIDRLGAPRAVLITLSGMALTLLLWPLGASALWLQALVLVPWALGCFSANSAQQARLVHMAPALAPATVALNTSALYGGQALGSALGGGLIAQGLMRQLHWFGLVLMLAAMALSWQAARVQKRSPSTAASPHTA